MAQRLQDYQDAVRAVLRQAPAGLVTDFDGTLSALVPVPKEAEIDPRCREALWRLAVRLALVAVVSGRAVKDVRGRVGLEGVVYLGEHGLARWTGGEVELMAEVAPFQGQLQAVARRLRPHLTALGVKLETKDASLALHYRGTSHPQRVRGQLLTLLAEMPEAQGLQLQEGKMHVEVRPLLAVDKGQALRRLVQEYGLRGVLFLGDDVSDLAALRTVMEMRAAGRVAGLAVGVRGSEAPPELAEVSDYVLEGVTEVAEFLTWLAQVVEESGKTE